MKEEGHPVWEVYDLYRTARLNVKYYSECLHRVERQNFFLELILACTASTSVVAGFWFFETPLGHVLWTFLSVIAGFVAVVKPLLGLPKKMKEYESLLFGYKTLEHDLHEVKSNIVHKKKYNQALQAEFKKAMKRKGILVGKDPDPKENKRIKQKCESEVLSELPSKLFYIPEE